jgi:thymidylate synthase (FAD)|tara:strand:- start:3161 stop:3895 length:735 start_codon:yes stop_codon:yes gene_type:complete
MKFDLYNDNIGKVEYVEHMGSDLSVVNSARVSFGKHKEELDDKDKKLIKYLIKHRHTSTLEHCLVTFRFKVPLFIRSQHHRHRTWSYNEISRRYTEENLQFYEPRTFRTQSKSNRQASNLDILDPIMGYFEDGGPNHASATVRDHHRRSVSLYNELMEKGVCREQARGVLPQNLYTEYYGTCNANNLLKFCGLRLHDGAQWEIQKVAEGIISICKNIWPITIQAYIDCLKDRELAKRLENIEIV